MEEESRTENRYYRRARKELQPTLTRVQKGSENTKKR